MAGGKNQRRGGNKENKISNGNKKPSSTSKKHPGKSFQKREYKFFGHEALKKNNGYTYGRIVEQIIIKIQTNFEGPTGSMVVDILRSHTKYVFNEPEMEESTKMETTTKVLDTQCILREWEKDYDQY